MPLALRDSPERKAAWPLQGNSFALKNFEDLVGCCQSNILNTGEIFHVQGV
jgi:hypothetical protein